MTASDEFRARVDNCAHMAGGTTTSGDGTRIAYERRGDGPPLVPVSGALGTAARHGSLTGQTHTVAPQALAPSAFFRNG
ncbi:hypothetical protein [Streptomyces lavendofoliae]|uniref:Uncharacterized protein n=1 Tax=Streptomyces lavendofoliae TaxID=67314 RepID=A0A918M4V6_9ACTN|nr:hypothetical protein GCM10010274_35020 [Streptomyces lavendofoliae]